MAVNVCKKKRLTNMRAGGDEVRLVPAMGALHWAVLGISLR